MSYKKIENEIKKSLDNLDNVTMSNRIKAEVILEAIKPFLDEEFFDLPINNNGTENVSH